MAFCNIHCLRKSSRIIVIPTTSVNVLWDAIVPLSPAPTLIGSSSLAKGYDSGPPSLQKADPNRNPFG